MQYVIMESWKWGRGVPTKDLEVLSCWMPDLEVMPELTWGSISASPFFLKRQLDTNSGQDQTALPSLPRQ